MKTREEIEALAKPFGELPRLKIQERFGDVLISTVSVAHVEASNIERVIMLMGGEPTYTDPFETMVFDLAQSDEAIERRGYASMNEAINGHQKIAKRFCRSDEKPDADDKITPPKYISLSEGGLAE